MFGTSEAVETYLYVLKMCTVQFDRCNNIRGLIQYCIAYLSKPKITQLTTVTCRVRRTIRKRCFFLCCIVILRYELLSCIDPYFLPNLFDSYLLTQRPEAQIFLHVIVNSVLTLVNLIFICFIAVRCTYITRFIL